jgi:hypothetical protein
MKCWEKSGGKNKKNKKSIKNEKSKKDSGEKCMMMRFDRRFSKKEILRIVIICCQLKVDIDIQERNDYYDVTLEFQDDKDLASANEFFHNKIPAFTAIIADLSSVLSDEKKTGIKKKKH